LLIDFALHYDTKASEKQCVAMLIVVSEDDLYFKADSRAKLRALYPEAEVRSFNSGGHLLAITKRDEYVELVAEFVRE
jgi:pimeloyl-ACP methyl ester carboxylesterase